MEIVSTVDGWMYLFRWIHFMAGITWIGLLYYFNFVQAPFFGETEANVRTAAIAKLVPRALWWFRWAAMATFLSGLAMLAVMGHQFGGSFFDNPRGISIVVGATFATFMWANVWFVIWPKQRIVIASAQQVAGGGAALPEAAAAGRRALLASRTNVVFSIPMLFFMGAGSHVGAAILSGPPTESGKMLLPLVTFGVAGLIELNALMGTQGATKKPLESVSGVIHAGLALTLVMYLACRVVL